MNAIRRSLDCRQRHSVFSGEGASGFSRLIATAYLFRDLAAQFIARSVAMPSFGNLIVHVVLLGAEKEVVRIDATRVVALMQDIHTNRNAAAMKQPRKAMRPHLTTNEVKVPVLIAGIALEVPAPALVNNNCGEEGFGGGKLRLRHDLGIPFIPRSASTARAFAEPLASPLYREVG